MAYTGAWTWPTKVTLAKWGSGVERGILEKMGIGRSPYLFWDAVLFALDCEAFRQESWRTRRVNLRMCSAALPLSIHRAGRWQSVAQKWGWTFLEDDFYATPDGIVQLGGDGKPALTAAAIRGWQRTLWEADRRACDGMEVLRTGVPSVVTHRRWAHEAVSKRCEWGRLHTAIGACIDSKVATKIAAKEELQLDTTCVCGNIAPDRAHWMWECPSHQAPHPPRCLAQKKLGIPLVPRQRVSHRRTIPTEAVQEIAQEIMRLHRAGISPVVATDGGSNGKDVWERCGGWGIAVGSVQVSGVLQGLDHSAFAAELWAGPLCICS